MGEDAPKIRTRICNGLEFLGIALEEARNVKNAPLISSDNSRVAVRVIHTDESATIARNVQEVVKNGKVTEDKVG